MKNEAGGMVIARSAATWQSTWTNGLLHCVRNDEFGSQWRVWFAM